MWCNRRGPSGLPRKRPRRDQPHLGSPVTVKDREERSVDVELEVHGMRIFHGDPPPLQADIAGLQQRLSMHGECRYQFLRTPIRACRGLLHLLSWQAPPLFPQPPRVHAHSSRLHSRHCDIHFVRLGRPARLFPPWLR